jgi:hypothetical protein
MPCDSKIRTAQNPPVDRQTDVCFDSKTLPLYCHSTLHVDAGWQVGQAACAGGRLRNLPSPLLLFAHEWGGQGALQIILQSPSEQLVPSVPPAHPDKAGRPASALASVALHCAGAHAGR